MGTRVSEIKIGDTVQCVDFSGLPSNHYARDGVVLVESVGVYDFGPPHGFANYIRGIVKATGKPITCMRAARFRLVPPAAAGTAPEVLAKAEVRCTCDSWLLFRAGCQCGGGAAEIQQAKAAGGLQ